MKHLFLRFPLKFSEKYCGSWGLKLKHQKKISMVKHGKCKLRWCIRVPPASYGYAVILAAVVRHRSCRCRVRNSGQRWSKQLIELPLQKKSDLDPLPCPDVKDVGLQPGDQDAAEVEYLLQPGHGRPEAGNLVWPARAKNFDALLKVADLRWLINFPPSC